MEEIANQKTFRNYLILWSGQLFSLLGSMVVHFIITWWIQEKTNNPIFLAIASLMYFLPMLIATPIAGVLSDRINRKKIILAVDSLQAVATFILIMLFLMNFTEIWIIFIFLAIRSIFQGFHYPTVSSVIPLMVPKDKLSRINGVNFLFSGLVQLIGPALAAALSLFLTFHQILWIDIITFFIALIPLLLIQIPSVERKESSKSADKPSFFTDFKEGFVLLRSIPVLLTIIILAMFLNFLIQPLGVLLPYYVNSLHGGTLNEYAFVSVSMNAGMILGAMVTIKKKKWNHKILTTFIGIIFLFLGYAYLALIPTGFFIMMVIGLLMMGITLPIINTIFQTIEQTIVPPDKIGRVMSIDSTLSMIISPLGIILTGILSVPLGVTTLFLFCGIIGVVISIATYLFTNIRHFEKEKKTDSETLSASDEN
ncbi:MAG: MFS transporter [Candidatus Lokiarchaeota archaeon]|nr:MFS transporter [Candidatus Lokiarchaeota archaeon]